VNDEEIALLLDRHPPCSPTFYESEARIGGRIVVSGFLFGTHRISLEDAQQLLEKTR
jgi:hypothetical protein